MNRKHSLIIALAALALGSCGGITPAEVSVSHRESTPVASSQTAESSSAPASSSSSEAKKDYFDGYSMDYLPTYSPLKTDAMLYDDQEEIEVTFAADTLQLDKGLTTDMLRLSGALEGLEVSSVSVKDNALTMKASGKLVAGTGYVGLAREATDAKIFTTALVPVQERHLTIDESTFRVFDDNKKIDFTIVGKNVKLANPDNLSKDDFMAKANSGEITAFAVNLSDKGYSLEMIAISDDFTSFRLRLTLPEALKSEAVAKELLENVKILIPGSCLSDHQDHELHVDVLHPSTQSSVRLTKANDTLYNGTFEIKLCGCQATPLFKDNVGKFTLDPANQNFLVTIPGVVTSVTELSVPDETTIKGKFVIPMPEETVEQATVTLGEITVDDTVGHVAMDWFSDTGVTPDAETVVCTYDDPGESEVVGGGTGTVTQSAEQSYRTVKSAVEVSTFDGDSEDVNDAETVINAATNIGMIGYGLYSGDLSFARNGASKLLGLSDIADPSTRILTMLSSIYDKLLEIEAKIDSIIDKLDVIQAELEQLGQQSLLTNYLAAHSAWKDFVTDYYVPLKDAVVSYSNDYFRYFYSLVIDSYDPYEFMEPRITLHYDTNGKLCFPGRNPALSVDGKKIDKSATKEVVIPVLHHCLMGIFANDGHVYPDIENDLIADFFAYGAYDQELVADILRTIRFEAMESHFLTSGDLDAFTATFANFCTALTSTEFGASLNATITPLDCYRIMLETVYNFGFEIEPEFNLIVTKIESTYYCARSILDLVRLINAGEFVSPRYGELDKAVQNEFTSDRFYHANRDDKTIYCYGTANYLTWNIDAYGVTCGVTGDYDSGYDDDYYVTRAETFSPTNHDEPGSLTSIDEASVRLMALKVKLYNNLKGTAYNFGEYLGRIGIIPKNKLKQTLGVILEYDGVVGKGDMKKMKYAAGWTLDFDRANAAGFEGKSYSFSDGAVIDGLLCGMTWNDLSTPLGTYVGPDETTMTNVGFCAGGGYDFGVWAYYVNFLPAAVE